MRTVILGFDSFDPNLFQRAQACGNLPTWAASLLKAAIPRWKFAPRPRPNFHSH